MLCTTEIVQSGFESSTFWFACIFSGYRAVPSSAVQVEYPILSLLRSRRNWCFDVPAPCRAVPNWSLLVPLKETVSALLILKALYQRQLSSFHFLLSWFCFSLDAVPVCLLGMLSAVPWAVQHNSIVLILLLVCTAWQSKALLKRVAAGWHHTKNLSLPTGLL